VQMSWESSLSGLRNSDRKEYSPVVRLSLLNICPMQYMSCLKYNTSATCDFTTADNVIVMSWRVSICFCSIRTVRTVLFFILYF
jgi:hypothetical protein